MNLVQRTFGVLAALTLLTSLLMGAFFISALVTGGDIAIQLSSIAQKISVFSMYLATLAVAVGLVSLYISGKHELTFVIPKKDNLE